MKTKYYWKFLAGFLLFAFVTMSCGLGQVVTGKPTAAVPTEVSYNPNQLVVATSPDMTPLMRRLAEKFNANPANGTVKVDIEEASSSDMVANALSPAPKYQVINPDSSIWLSKLDAEWAKTYQPKQEDSSLPIAIPRYSTPIRFAISPIVIAMWEETVKGFSDPKAIGWADIQRRAKDGNFKWNHPSTDYASGLLATLAEFYGGAGVKRGLTAEMATSAKTVEYVRQLESSIRFYGESEVAILDKLKANGTDTLDAFVAQEQIVLRWNRENPSQKKLQAIYPVDGTMWADHPLTLLEFYSGYDQNSLTNEQRNTYFNFASFLKDEGTQKEVLTEGYRPTSMQLTLNSEAPFAGNPAVDALQPKTTLPIPAYSVVQVVENAWSIVKKPTNVYMVVDTSGSMNAASKLPKVKSALEAFVGHINGIQDKIGIINFSTGVKYDTGLIKADKEKLNNIIGDMEAGGDTAILDAVLRAYEDLQRDGDPNAINALVVMTDGQENASTQIDLGQLNAKLADPDNRVKVVVFSIAFGSDADDSIMKSIAEHTKGQFSRSDEINIEKLYETISKYL
jgi:Ca-activated chloride channel homolog